MIRICRLCLQQASSGPLYDAVQDLCARCFLPAFPLLPPGNPALGQEVWLLLQLFPYEIRFQLYGYWKNETSKMHPEIKLANMQTIKDCKYILQRITKDNIKKFGRQIGKLGHTNPVILFGEIVSKVQVH